jgi:predicted phosphate transport protein (TIGR00153 family)
VSILDLFARSPIKPLQEHMHSVLDCVREVEPFFEAVCSGDQEGIEERQRRIDELEGQADRLKNDLRAHLPRRLLLPVDRRDLLEILDLQDSMADTAQDVAGIFMERPMPVPESMRRPLTDLVRAVGRTCEQAGSVVDQLDELVELGFRGREADRVEGMIDELGHLEGETDQLGITLTRELFRLESELPPVSVMLWYQLIGWIGDIADNAEKVGNRLRLLIAR